MGAQPQLQGGDLRVPAGGVARLVSLDFPGMEWSIFVSADPAQATPAFLGVPGAMITSLHHAAGQSWPHRNAETLGIATLLCGGVTILCFRTLGDALACQRRLCGGAA